MTSTDIFENMKEIIDLLSSQIIQLLREGITDKEKRKEFSSYLSALQKTVNSSVKLNKVLHKKKKRHSNEEDILMMMLLINAMRGNQEKNCEETPDVNPFIKMMMLQKVGKIDPNAVPLKFLFPSLSSRNQINNQEEDMKIKDETKSNRLIDKAQKMFGDILDVDLLQKFVDALTKLPEKKKKTELDASDLDSL